MSQSSRSCSVATTWFSTRKISDEREEYLRKIAMLNGYGKIVRNEASALHFSQCFHKSSVTEASNAFLWSKRLT